MIRWWKKQTPEGDCHDDYSTGNPESKFCARCKRLEIVKPEVKLDTVDRPRMLTVAEAHRLLRSVSFQ